MLDGRHFAIIEDDEIMGASLRQRLELEGAQVAWWRTAEEALAGLRAAKGAFDAVICDIRLPDRDGEEVFRAVSALMPPPPFLFLTAYGDIDQAVRLLRQGASDYLTKPFEFDAFVERLEAIARSPEEIEATGALGVSEAMRDVEETLRRVADLDLPVLITGETGVGKEVAARFLHGCSSRSEAPVVAVNCAAIPAELLESELFGHEKGAFTGAQTRHEGFAERAGQGVLFLDEIAEMPLALQPKLLRLIEERSFYRIGGETPVPFRARVISATNQHVEKALSDGPLRRDLFFRLNTITITIPPLRERPEDAVWLLRRFFEAATTRRPSKLRAISALAEEAVQEYDWPGNVRELRNRLDRAVALARGEVLTVYDLFPEEGRAEEGRAPIEPLAEARAAAERRQILRALERTGGRISDAARLLRISRTTLWEKMQRLGL